MELNYLTLLERAAMEGQEQMDRTEVGTRSLFGEKILWDLQHSFPLLTTKRVHFKSVVEELLWFLRGETNVNTLDASIWDEWSSPSGELGPIYSKQWRDWDGIDQIQGVIDSIKANPAGRRHIVSAWNVGELDQMALPPCHLLFQFYVRDGLFLDCQVYQRSADLFLGVPFNLASYGLLTHIVGHYTGYKPGKLHWVGGDCHVYLNHLPAVATQLVRNPVSGPKLAVRIPEGVTFDKLKAENFLLSGYDPHPSIKAKVAV
jgi:thymidylate synthase